MKRVLAAIAGAVLLLVYPAAAQDRHINDAGKQVDRDRHINDDVKASPDRHINDGAVRSRAKVKAKGKATASAKGKARPAASGNANARARKQRGLARAGSRVHSARAEARIEANQSRKGSKRSPFSPRGRRGR